MLPWLQVVNGSLDIAGIMNSWTKQTGLPVITIRELSLGLFHVDQQRFLLNPEDKFNESTSPYGSVSIIYQFSGYVYCIALPDLASNTLNA